VLSIAIQGFLKISTLAMLPVFLATPSNPNQPQNPRDFDVIKRILGGKGGFGLDTISTSKVLLSQAAVCIVGQILLVPAIISRHGPLHSYRVAVFILLCIYYLLPFTANWTSWTGIPTMLIILWVYPLTSSLATTCSAILYASLSDLEQHSLTFAQNYKHRAFAYVFGESQWSRGITWMPRTHFRPCGLRATVSIGASDGLCWAFLLVTWCCYRSGWDCIFISS
jgi:hypothetical protein